MMEGLIQTIAAVVTAVPLMGAFFHWLWEKRHGLPWAARGVAAAQAEQERLNRSRDKGEIAPAEYARLTLDLMKTTVLVGFLDYLVWATRGLILLGLVRALLHFLSHPSRRAGPDKA